jgi:hypothetical protein
MWEQWMVSRNRAIDSIIRKRFSWLAPYCMEILHLFITTFILISLHDMFYVRRWYHVWIYGMPKKWKRNEVVFHVKYMSDYKGLIQALFDSELSKITRNTIIIIIIIITISPLFVIIKTQQLPSLSWHSGSLYLVPAVHCLSTEPVLRFPILSVQFRVLCVQIVTGWWRRYCVRSRRNALSVGMLLWRTWKDTPCILMYVPYILYSSVSTPTKAQRIYIYIYINILCIVSTATCFDTSASSSGSVILLLY